MLKRKIEEKQAGTASKEAESSSKPAEPIKDPVVEEFDIESWFTKPDWKNRPQLSAEELKVKIETWFKGRDWKATPARQLKFFTQHKKLIKGEVISWKYLTDLKCIAILADMEYSTSNICKI